jgi:hypothetical protein
MEVSMISLLVYGAVAGSILAIMGIFRVLFAGVAALFNAATGREGGGGGGGGR